MHLKVRFGWKQEDELTPEKGKNSCTPYHSSSCLLRNFKVVHTFEQTEKKKPTTGEEITKTFGIRIQFITT
jgi:hypothetical protein